MMPFGFHQLGQSLLFLLLIPLIIFYFLKLRRPRLEIPSLLLWQQVLSDRRVNSPFQRFKRNLLLLLQILLLCLIVLAAMQPFWRGQSRQADLLPVLIDTSASMAALDKPGGASRLDLAKEKLARRIDDLLPNQQLALITFNTSAAKVCDFTSNKRILRAALDAITVEDLPADVEEPLRMADALARNRGCPAVLLLSDGNFPADASFDLPFELVYDRLPPAGPNLGITAFNARRTRTGSWNVFVRVECTPDTDYTATITLHDGDAELASEDVVLAAERAQRLVFTVDGDRPLRLTARIDADRFDALAADDQAYLDLPPLRPLSVFLAPELVTYRQALAGHRDLAISHRHTGDTARYDLVISDREQDRELPAATAFFTGVVPTPLADLVTVSTDGDGSALVDWQRGHPLLQHVELAELLITETVRAAPEVGDADFENRRFRIVAFGRDAPLLLERDDPELLQYHCLFHTDRSTLPYRVGFPILLSNLLQLARHRAGIAEAVPTPTGVLGETRLTPGATYTLTGPRGVRRQIATDETGLARGLAMPFVGRYRLAIGALAAGDYAASLVNSHETSLAAAKEIRFNELAVAAADVAPRGDRPLWKLCVILALAALLVEWWYFQKRPAGIR